MNESNNPNIIAGRQIPKWVMPDGIYTIGEQAFDVRETLGKNSQFLQEQELRDAAKATRKSQGLCDKCRSTPCLCNFGQ